MWGRLLKRKTRGRQSRATVPLKNLLDAYVFSSCKYRAVEVYPIVVLYIYLCKVRMKYRAYPKISQYTVYIKSKLSPCTYIKYHITSMQ